MRIRLLILGFSSLFFITNIQAQITIGSHEANRKGSLLDIKRENNEKKGLGLPRVALLSPNTLTVDDDANRDKYVGLTVYNITDNGKVSEGIYSWEGTKWRRAVSVDSYGSNRQLLTTDGSGSYTWSTFTVPIYTFNKPTQISAFNPRKVTFFDYSFGDLGTKKKTGSNYIYVPSSTTRFEKDYVYTDTLRVKADVSKTKYILLGITAIISEKTVGDAEVKTAFWQKIKVEVFVGNVLKKEYERIFSTPAGGTTSTYIDLFSMIPLTGLTVGDHILKVRISNLENSFPYNKGTGSGQFNIGENKFYRIGLEDFNLVLYEDD